MNNLHHVASEHFPNSLYTTMRSIKQSPHLNNIPENTVTNIFCQQCYNNCYEQFSYTLNPNVFSNTISVWTGLTIAGNIFSNFPLIFTDCGWKKVVGSNCLLMTFSHKSA